MIVLYLVDINNVTLRKETVDFNTFVKILAHFRPVDKDRPKDPNSPEPINSRSNKLKCMFAFAFTW